MPSPDDWFMIFLKLGFVALLFGTLKKTANATPTSTYDKGSNRELIDAIDAIDTGTIT